MKILYSILILLILYVSLAEAQNRAELERRRNHTLKEIEETENILGTVNQSKTESIEKLNLLDKKINLRNTLIVNLSTEVNEVDKKIFELEKTTESLGANIKEIKQEYGRMIYLSYLNREQSNKLMFLLSSNSMNQAYKRLKYLQQYSEYRKKQIAVISGFQATLNGQIRELENTKLEKSKLLNTQERENKVLKMELDEKSKTVSILKSKETELKRKLKEKSKLADKLAADINKIIEAEIRAKAEKKAKAAIEKTSKREIVEDNILTGSFQDNRGKLPWPTDRGVVTRGFGKYRHPVYSNVDLENLGIDISTVSNSPVYAVLDGQVLNVAFIKGSNYVVIINHGRFYTVYQNLSSVSVREGSKVKGRQVIGKVYTDNDSKSATLHFQVWDEMRRLDPEIWLSQH